MPLSEGLFPAKVNSVTFYFLNCGLKHLFRMKVYHRVISFICLFICLFNLQGQNNSTSCVLLRNQASAIPIQSLADKKIAYINLSDQSLEVFKSTLENYFPITLLNKDEFNSDALSCWLKYLSSSYL